MMGGQFPGNPFGLAPPLPQQAHDHRGQQRRHAARQHHLRLPRKRDGRRDQHHRVDCRRREHEGQRRTGRRTAEQPTRHRHRTTLAARQRRTADPGDGHRQHRLTGKPAFQPLRGDIGRHQTADHGTERQERQRLHEHPAKHRGRGRQPVVAGQHAGHERPGQRQAEQGHQQQFHRPGTTPAHRQLTRHGSILPGKAGSPVVTGDRLRTDVDRECSRPRRSDFRGAKTRSQYNCC